MCRGRHCKIPFFLDYFSVELKAGFRFSPYSIDASQSLASFSVPKNSIPL